MVAKPLNFTPSIVVLGIQINAEAELEITSSSNCNGLHSALGYRTPVQAEEDYCKKSEDSLLNAA